LKVLICQPRLAGRRDRGYSVDDYLRVVREHVGANIFDFVLINQPSHLPTGGQTQVIFRTEDSTKHPEVRFIAADVVNVRIRHTTTPTSWRA